MTCSTSFSSSATLAGRFLAFVLLSGCASPDAVMVPAMNRAARIAVLPVENLTGDRAPLDEMSRSLRSSLSLRGFNLLDDAALEEFMRRHRVRYTGGMKWDVSVAMREETGAEGVLVTSLESYEEGEPPKVALFSRLVSSGKDPAIIWMESAGLSGEQSVGLLGLGRISEAEVLARKAIQFLTDSLAESLPEGGGTVRSAPQASDVDLGEACDDQGACPGVDDGDDGDRDGETDDGDPNALTEAEDTEDDGACSEAEGCSELESGWKDRDVWPGDEPPDSEGDTVQDRAELSPDLDDSAEANGDGAPDAADTPPQADPEDTDQDGVRESEDPCPDGSAACDAEPASRARSAAGGGRFRPRTFFRSPDIDAGRRYTIAVLPFLNLSDRRSAGQIASLHFVTSLIRTGAFTVIDPGLVREQLLKYRIIMEGGASLAHADAISSKSSLGVDLVLSGEVFDYQDAVGVPKVDFSAFVFEKQTRRVVWSSRSYNDGEEGVFLFDFGRVYTAHRLASEMARQTVELLAP